MRIKKTDWDFDQNGRILVHNSCGRGGLLSDYGGSGGSKNNGQWQIYNENKESWPSNILDLINVLHDAPEQRGMFTSIPQTKSEPIFNKEDKRNTGIMYLL